MKISEIVKQKTLDLFKINESKMLPEYVYHSSYMENIPSIKKHGLDPSKSQSSLDAVFLAGDEYTARNYFDHHLKNKNSILIRIPLHKLKQQHLGPDNYELHDYLENLDEDDEFYGLDWNDLTWEQSLNLVSQVAYHDKISPKYLEIKVGNKYIPLETYNNSTLTENQKFDFDKYKPQIMKISEITKNKIPKFLYKWVNGNQFQKYLNNKQLPVKRNYAHYIDEKNDFVKGNSFTDKKNINRWTGDTLIKIDTTQIKNNIYPIPGHRTYLKTMGMINNDYDPNAYKYESEDIDEYWIEGTLDLSSAEIIKTTLTENQKFDFDKYKPQIMNYIKRIKSNQENPLIDNALFYDIITNKPTVGAAKSININPQVWKNYFSNKPFNSNGVWSQRDFNPQLKDNTNNINFYITVEKSNDNIIKFIQTLRFLDKDLEELSNKTQSRISYKTHTILDSFMDHNDSLKIYYNNPQLKNQIQSVTKQWASKNNVILSNRTHEHGLDTDKSFGERLAKSVNDTIKNTIKKYNTYSDEQLFEWIKKYLPEMIQTAKDSKQ